MKQYFKLPDWSWVVSKCTTYFEIKKLCILPLTHPTICFVPFSQYITIISPNNINHFVWVCVVGTELLCVISINRRPQITNDIFLGRAMVLANSRRPFNTDVGLWSQVSVYVGFVVDIVALKGASYQVFRSITHDYNLGNSK